MENNDCSQCGLGSKNATGILFEKKLPYIDAMGGYKEPSWQRVGQMCPRHLEINGGAARENGYETMIEPIIYGIERK